MDTAAVKDEALDLLSDLSDAAVRIVTRSVTESPELLRRAAVAARLKAAGMPETDPVYIAALEDVEVYGVLLLQRAQLRTEAEVVAFGKKVAEWAIRIAGTVIAAAL